MKFSFICAYYILFFILFSNLSCFLNVAFAENSPEYTETTENVTFSVVSEKETISNDKIETIDSENKIEPSVVVQSSFEELQNSNGAEDFSSPYEVLSQNSGITNNAADNVQDVVYTFVDTSTADLQHKADIPSAITSQTEQPLPVEASNVTVKQTETELPVVSNETKSENSTEEASATQQTDTDSVETNVSKIEPKTNITETMSAKPEDIPSFSEWAQKQLEEAEREQANHSAQQWNGKLNTNLKVRSKNYASPDCGAKIVAANPEAVSASAVLSPSRDEYLLNTCTSRIWFIVELCEAIQAKKIDLANFELFSSSPKDISVFVSDRFPSRDWSNVGNFAAKDERDIQSFDLHPHLFGKYIKVEMHSHHGSEHFCPISLFRVYGTSEFEVLEKEDRGNTNEDDDDDETLEDNGTAPKNLFSSATDAVILIVKKAAEVLGNKGNASNQTTETDSVQTVKYSPLISTCTTPSHLIVCDNCSDVLFGQVYELLSCRSKEIVELAAVNFIKKILRGVDVCDDFGFDFSKKRRQDVPYIHKRYLKAIFPAKYIAALCNTVAVLESNMVLNVSKQFPNMTQEATSNVSNKITNIEITEPHIRTPSTDFQEILPTDALTLENLNFTLQTTQDDPSYVSQIKPTKTLTPDEVTNNSLNTATLDQNTDTVQPTEPVNLASDSLSSAKISTEPVSDSELNTISISEFESVETSDENLDKLLSDALNADGANAPSVTTPPSVMPQGQKESVFLRLSNRIKNLERNMSLSSQYLEELSRRYKKQVEEMQRLLEKTINTFSEESKQTDERNKKLEEQLEKLTSVVDSLIDERNRWMHSAYCILIAAFGIWFIFAFCRRNSDTKRSVDNGQETVKILRRKSIDVVTHQTPPKKTRRPSEEALKIGGTYQHLLVDEIDGVRRDRKEKKRRKKKTSLARSNSITTLTEGVQKDFSPYLTHNRYLRQEPTTPQIKDWVNDSSVRDAIERVPFPLEESEHSPLEPLPYDDEEHIHEIKSNGAAYLNYFLTNSFIRKTAADERSKRKSSPNGQVLIINGNRNKTEMEYKKSFSVDETVRKKSPLPSSGTTSLNSSFEDKISIKKEKKSGLKRILKKVF